MLPSIHESIDEATVVLTDELRHYLIDFEAFGFLLLYLQHITALLINEINVHGGFQVKSSQYQPLLPSKLIPLLIGNLAHLINLLSFLELIVVLILLKHHVFVEC